VSVEDHLERFDFGIEGQQVGIDAVPGRAQIDLAVEPGHDGEIAALLITVLGGDLVGVAEQPFRRRGLRRGREGKGEQAGEPGEPTGAVEDGHDEIPGVVGGGGESLVAASLASLFGFG
jgi:hypothetical protein